MIGLLKFITCGSVDDGKSTLIGHMLYEAKLLFTDQQKALELDSKLGSREGKLDYSLLLDGLTAEREQGITIDVAYRFFSTENRTFIVADCPGHEQYTRNMAVGASFADLAVVLTDAAKGLQTQTKRHVRICSLMGIRHFILAVNKMDLVSYDHHVFEEIQAEFAGLAYSLGAKTVYAIPVSATEGDNIIAASLRMPWFKGLPLLPYLEQIDAGLDIETGTGADIGIITEAAGSSQSSGFCLPVQRVCRPSHTFRGFQGQVETGRIMTGDEIVTLPERERAHVRAIYIGDRETDIAGAGQPVTICLDKEIDISRGSVLVNGKEPEVSSALTASVLWMDKEELVSGRHYFLKCGTKTLPATVMAIKYKNDINNGRHLPADKLFQNEMGVCDISLSEKMVFDLLDHNKALGGFILMDRVSNMTSGCGVILHSLRRSGNIFWNDTDVTSEMRAEIKSQKPLTIWFTGLSGSGKTVLANALEKRLFALGKHTMLLDGDNIRHGLSKNLGFKEADRIENLRRVSEVAKLMNAAGLIVLTAFISPYESERENARSIIGASFRLVHVSTPLAICEERDVKGLYAKARRGEIPNFTGITDVFEIPAEPELTIDTGECTIDEAVEMLLERFF